MYVRRTVETIRTTAGPIEAVKFDGMPVLGAGARELALRGEAGRVTDEDVGQGRVAVTEFLRNPDDQAPFSAA